MLKSRHVLWLHPFVTNPRPAQKRSRDGASHWEPNPDPEWESQPLETEITVRWGELSITLNMVQISQGWNSLEAHEECRFVQASEYSLVPSLSVLLILCRINYLDLYQSHRREIFLLSLKLGLVGHCRCFSFPTRAGGMRRESQRFPRWPWRALGKRALCDHTPMLN